MTPLWKCVPLILLLVSGLAYARAGGGEDFAGSSSGTTGPSDAGSASPSSAAFERAGSDDGEGGGELCILGAGLAAFGLMGAMEYSKRQRTQRARASAAGRADEDERREEAKLERPLPHDPGWSRFVAEEMGWLVVQRAYGAHSAEARTALDRWAEPVVCKLLHKDGPWGDVVIGGLHLVERTHGEEGGREQLEFSVELVRAGPSGGFWARESWFFERPEGVRSPSLQIVQALGLGIKPLIDLVF